MAKGDHEHTEAMLRQIEFSKPAHSLDQALRRGNALERRREWRSIGRLVATALIVWAVNGLASMAINRAIAIGYVGESRVAVANAGCGRPDAVPPIAIAAWPSRWALEMALEEEMKEWPTPAPPPEKTPPNQHNDSARRSHQSSTTSRVGTFGGGVSYA
jgi:hypothetical protein